MNFLIKRTPVRAYLKKWLHVQLQLFKITNKVIKTTFTIIVIITIITLSIIIFINIVLIKALKAFFILFKLKK